MRHLMRMDAVGVAVALVVSCGMVARADESQKLLLVVPARPAVVRFCADVVRMKSAAMVCYESRQHGGRPELFLWKAASGDWVKISADEYRSGAIFGPGQRRVLVAGTDRAALAALVELSAGLGDVATIDRLDLMSMANSINDIAPFTSGQWKALARRHDLQLKDLNEERRRYGRFGKPGEGPALPKVMGTSPLPPALTETHPVEAPAEPAQPAQPAVRSPADK